MFFAAAVRDKTKAGLPKSANGVTDVAKAIGAQWGKLSDKQKAPYQKQNAKDKKRYEKEMKQYKAGK